MNARFAVLAAGTALAGTVLVTACASSESTTEPGSNGAEDSTAPDGPEGEAGGGTETGPGLDGARADTSTNADASASGDAKPDADGGDATVMDVATTETGTVDATVDTGALDAGAGEDAEASAVDSSETDVEAEANADVGADSGSDADADAETLDASADGATDAGKDAGSDAGPDTGMGPGPVCQHPDGGNYFCNAGEHCCANAVTRDSNCGTSCDQGAGYYPVDCPGASGDGGCGIQTCCGMLVIDGGLVPNCNPTQLTSSCATTCNDNPPGALSGCVGSYTINLCTAAADCAGNANGNTYCCNFGTPPSPVNWCVSSVIYNTFLWNSCL